MSNIHKSKIGNQNPDAIMYQGADTPSEQQVTQGVKKLNPWKQECWHAEYIDSTNNKHVVWHKDKTLENCYIKYGIAKKVSSDSTYPAYTPNTYNVSASQLVSGKLSTDIPVIKEIEEFNPDILIQKYHVEDPKRAPRVIFASRNYPDNEYTQKLFQAIREYFHQVPIVGLSDVSSLFGTADTFGAHWHMGDVQQLYGTRSNWLMRIGDGTNTRAVDIHQKGVWMRQTFANVGLDSLTFSFNKNAVTIWDNTFSALKPSLWGTWNFEVRYENEAEPYPYIKYKPGSTEIEEFQGIIPVYMIKTFRASKISQEGLNNFFKNSILKYCTDLNGCFADKLRCWHDTVPAAYGCQPYEEVPNNTITIGQHIYWRGTKQLAKNIDNRYYFVYPGNGLISTETTDKGNLLETFMDSSIKYFHPVIDCTLIIDKWMWDRTFATYRISEGVHPMIDIRLKNLGNCEEYRFDSNGSWDGKNNTKHFSEATVKYLVNNCLDLSQYNPQLDSVTGVTYYRNGIIRGESKIYGPEEWRSKLSQEDLQGARRKNISIYINNELVN